MTTSATQVLQQATQLQQRFAAAQERIDPMLPASQVQELSYLSEDTLTLTNLQQRVQATYLGRQQNAIPGATEEELEAISIKLSESSEILERIQANNDIAIAIWVIANESVATNLTSETVNSLRSRIVDLTSKPHINAGNQMALQAMQNALSQVGRPGQQMSIFPPQAPSVQAPIQSTPPSPSTPPAPDQSSGRIIAEQTEELESSIFTDRLKGLSDSFTGLNPDEDFNKVLALYKEVKAYSLSKTSYYSSENKEKVENVLQRMEVLMGQIITTQQEIERKQTEQVQAQQSSNSCFEELKKALEAACKDVTSSSYDPLATQKNVNTAFKKLGTDEKPKLFDALSAVLMEEKKINRPLPRGLLGQEFSLWAGSYDLKLKAVERIIPASTPAAPSAPPVVVERKADEMARRLSEAKNAVAPSAQTSPRGPAVTTSTTTSNRPSPAGPLHIADNDSIPDNLDTPALRGIKELQILLSLLQRGDSSEDLDELLGKLATLDSLGINLPFKISGNRPQSIADRPCFHLYFIHKNESPEKLVNDAHYGANAMAGFYPTSNVERQRAIQRTIVEAALEGLDDAVNLEAPGDVISMLKILEDVQLDAIDRPSGSHNIAHTLFGMMYNLHNEARRTNSSLIDPSDRQFNGDFGRNAFRSFIAGIDPEIKIRAINAMQDALKAAWKV